MLSKKEQTSISKFISLILRHRTKDFTLKQDPFGFVLIKDFLRVLKRRFPEITSSEIEYVVKNCPKQRFEIKGEKIRARYGHSLKIDLDEKPKKPPLFLYHGTSPSFVQRIKKDGLKPMRRQYVHLSKTVDQAIEVGKRRAKKPVVFKIFAHKAFERGILFYDMGEVVLVQNIPAEFLKILG